MMHRSGQGSVPSDAQRTADGLVPLITCFKGIVLGSQPLRALAVLYHNARINIKKTREPVQANWKSTTIQVNYGTQRMTGLYFL